MSFRWLFCINLAYIFFIFFDYVLYFNKKALFCVVELNLNITRMRYLKFFSVIVCIAQANTTSGDRLSA